MSVVHEVPDGAIRPYEATTWWMRVQGGAVALNLDGVRLVETARKTVLAERIEALREATADDTAEGVTAAKDVLSEIQSLNAFWSWRPNGGEYSLQRAAEDAADGEPVVIGRSHAHELLTHAQDHPELAAIVAATKETR